MRMTSKLFNRLYRDETVLLVTDIACSFVDLPDVDDRPPFVAMVLELQHPELTRPYKQMFRVPPHLALALGPDLVAHAQASPPDETPH